jgi:hypothetical protein
VALSLISAASQWHPENGMKKEIADEENENVREEEG